MIFKHRVIFAKIEGNKKKKRCRNMIKTVGKKFNRALHFDFHTPPGIGNMLENFDAEH